MKKLLSLLAGAAITASASTGVVSCSATGIQTIPNSNKNGGNSGHDISADTKSFMTTSVDATVTKENPTSQELKQAFAISDANGETVNDAEYKYSMLLL